MKNSALFGLVLLFFIGGCNNSTSIELVHEMSQPGDFMSISPDGKYLVLTQQNDILKVINLTTAEYQDIVLPDDGYIPDYFFWNEAQEECWLSTSSLCVRLTYSKKDKGQVLDLRGSEAKLLLLSLEEAEEMGGGRTVSCSDCSTRDTRMRGSWSPVVVENLDADEVFAYFDSSNLLIMTAGNRGAAVELRIQGSTDPIITHDAGLKRCVHVDDMRLSPNGDTLAYTLSFGCHWISQPELHVLQLDSGADVKIMTAVYGPVRWAERTLYFYACRGECDGEQDGIFRISLSS